MSVTQVILPFEKVGTWWHDNKGQKGVMLTNETLAWLRQYDGLRWRRTFMFGPDKAKWKVLFEFNQAAPATLFKLTFGGQ